MGERVKAKMDDWSSAYAGEVVKVNRDGTFAIVFDDGERRQFVRGSQIVGPEVERERGSGGVGVGGDGP